MRFTKAARWVAAAFVAAVMTAALGTTAAKASAERAFRGHTDGTIQFTSLDPLQATITGSGQAAHMGNFTRLEHVTIDGAAVEGDITLTDVSTGDQIFISFEGAFVSGNDVEGTYTIEGGTGRFDGATGTAAFAANTPDFVSMTATWAGTIEY